MNERYPFSAQPWLSAYAPNVPHQIGEITETLPDMIEASVERHAQSVALEFFGATTTYAQLGARITRAAEGLRLLGVQAGTRVALVMPNSPAHIVAFYATLRLGAIVVEHNPLYTAHELGRQFVDHGATVAIVWNRVADTVSGLPKDTRPRHIVSVDITRDMPLAKQVALRLPVAKARAARDRITASPKAKELIPWQKIVSAAPLSPHAPRPELDDVALLQYTSGTTGAPKGAILTHRNLRANAMQGRAWVPGLREGEEVFYGVLPLFHAYGLTLCLTFAMSIGAKLVLFPTFDVDLIKDAVQKSPPTFLPAVPPIYDQLSRASNNGTIDLRSVRFAISGAMSLPVSTVDRWEKATGGLLVEGYGMTETSPVALGNPIGESRRPGTVGVPFPSTDIRVVDPEDISVDRGFGEAGELLLRGPQVFSGYWGQPEQTREVLLDGGWLRTGDIVTVAEDGFVTVVDRLKELIVTGGFNVAPTEVEEALRAHPSVADVAVVALPRGQGGEQVGAAIVLREKFEQDAAAIRDFARSLLAEHKVPRRIVFVDDLPRSLVGKVLRREVRERIIGAPKQTS
ncbi:long-chain acyl-CoA synthetase [Microbacterium endophyticum]|uniref:Long-chain acyl-CoA synthetase n=1 Tax=Microbacterium endophyticum TaxID=1526412 RepID=A0A7W4V0K6_9MICO|nr:long-chain-fatty-acid--CoA ligase [Microbacterium endophyticum]MBB2974671.1 long-chain acyl-CoA synthetase [Microbacterium endophyticum]NIK36968.1 long-chain acyl-CoA synthetase [Microbacterium endophyticum]